MYFHILKNDLRRKKTTNLILLIFIVLASMFMSSSVNNILTITNGLDSYFERAGMSDYFVATMGKVQGESIEKILSGIREVDSYGIEHVLYMNPDNLIYRGEKLETMKNTSILLALEDAKLNYFDENDEVIQSVEPGTVLIAGKGLQENHMEIGDTIEIKLCGVSKTFRIAGGFKDAALGSEMMGMTRFIIDEKDFKTFREEEAASMYGGSLCYIDTGDCEAVEKAIASQDTNAVFLGGADILKNTYVMDMVIAGVLLVVSVCLILIALVVLRFTISFTLTEEYREIGVMKAIGLQDTKIRGLYLVKYLALAVLGAGVGFLASVPFGNMLLHTAAQSVMIESDTPPWVNLGCSLALVALILLFCRTCTNRVRKFTPVDAIRSGTTGERFRKKGVVRIGNTSAGPSVFLAVNDVLSSPKRYGTMMLTFTLCLSLILILANTANTLQSGSLITSFGMTQSDVYYSDDGRQMSFMVENGRELLERRLDEIEQILADNGMEAECSNEVMLKLTLVNGSKTCKSQVLQGVRTTTDQYPYYEGTPPQSEDEVAVTPLIARKLDLHIGDTVTLRHLDGDREYLVTGIFQTMNNMGEGVRLHEDAEIDFLQTAGFFAIQISFTDHPGKKEIRERIERMKDIFDTDKIYDAGEYVDRIAGAGEAIRSLKTLVWWVVMIIISLLTVLMERSFLIRERGEIAILKAMGFRTQSIVKWHTVRFGIVAAASAAVSMLLAYPLTEAAVTPVFRMMGAYFGVSYYIRPLEVYLLDPLAAILIVALSAWAASLYAGKIKASETAGTE